MVRARRGAALVGREAELGALLRAFESCVAGAANVVLVTGEPGAGKSRLVAETRTLLETQHGALVLSGYALDGPEAMPPYFPLARALGPVLSSRRLAPKLPA